MALYDDIEYLEENSHEIDLSYDYPNDELIEEMRLVENIRGVPFNDIDSFCDNLSNVMIGIKADTEFENYVSGLVLFFVPDGYETPIFHQGGKIYIHVAVLDTVGEWLETPVFKFDEALRRFYSYFDDEQTQIVYCGDSVGDGYELIGVEERAHAKFMAQRKVEKIDLKAIKSLVEADSDDTEFDGLFVQLRHAVQKGMSAITITNLIDRINNAIRFRDGRKKYE